MSYHLLDEFQRLFDGRRYLHRIADQGDFIARQLYEDLYELGRSEKLLERVASKQRVVNVGNKRVGISARRGDGTFGELVPGAEPIKIATCNVSAGDIATIEIGAEVKILAKAMIKQIDRVIGDLRKQVDQFRKGGGNPISVAIVGINQAPYCVSYEKDRVYRTGASGAHPIKEAAEAERRLRDQAASVFDEFVVIRYSATNDEPYSFSWPNLGQMEAEYGASLVRISREYDRRF